MFLLQRISLFIWIWAFMRGFQYYWRSLTGTKTAEDLLIDRTVVKLQEFCELINKPADQCTEEEETAVIRHSLRALSSLQEAHGGEPLPIPGVSPAPTGEAFFTLPEDKGGWIKEKDDTRS